MPFSFFAREDWTTSYNYLLTEHYVLLLWYFCIRSISSMSWYWWKQGKFADFYRISRFHNYF